jgi:hypothetical protein
MENRRRARARRRVIGNAAWLAQPVPPQAAELMRRSFVLPHLHPAPRYRSCHAQDMDSATPRGDAYTVRSPVWDRGLCTSRYRRLRHPVLLPSTSALTRSAIPAWAAPRLLSVSQAPLYLPLAAHLTAVTASVRTGASTGLTNVFTYVTSTAFGHVGMSLPSQHRSSRDRRALLWPALQGECDSTSGFRHSPWRAGR